MFKKKYQSPPQQPIAVRYTSLVGEALPTLMEGPTPEHYRNPNTIKHWLKEQLEKTQHLLGYKRSDLKLLFGVIGTSFGPFPVGKLPPTVSPKDSPIETSSAQYIVQQYVAATGGSKLHNSIKNAYVMGKVKMAVSDFDIPNKPIQGTTVKMAETGCFVLWQMMPDKWYIELAIAGMKVQAGSDANLVWRYTPWSGSHAAEGPIRPLRRSLQGLDPRTIASMFVNARCMGEKRIGLEDCFVLKLAADSYSLAARSNVSEEIIRHTVFGYFSQKTGLLLAMEDSHLTRIQTSGGATMYWEISIESTIEDYKLVDGITVAHAGKSIAKVYKFGEASMSHSKTRVEECWTIEEVAFNVPGLSNDFFIPPAEMTVRSLSEASELSYEKEAIRPMDNIQWGSDD